MQTQKKALGIIFLTVVIYLVGFGIFIPMSPYLAREFGATPTEVGLLMSIFSLMQFVFAPFWGRLSDRIGRRPVLIFCLIGEGLSYIGFAFSSELWLLFVMRGISGFFGASISTASAYIADITPVEDRSKSMGLIGAAFGIGFVLGPALGGLLGSWGQMLGNTPPFGMSFSALWVALFCLLNALFAFKYLKESYTPEQREKAPVRKSRILQIYQHLKKPLVGRLMGIFFLSTLAMANMEATLFLYVADLFNWGHEKASFGFAYVGVMIAFTQGYLIRRFLPKWGERNVLFIGLIFMGVSLTSIGFAQDVYWLAVIMTALALGNGMLSPSVLGSISILTKKSEQGTVAGLNQGLAAIGRILGPALGGYLYMHWGLSSPFFAAGGIAFCALFIFLSIRKDVPIAGKKSQEPNNSPDNVEMISLFQLQNLVGSQVPFLLLNLCSDNSWKTLPPKALQLLEGAPVVDLSQVLSTTQKRAEDLAYPVILICKDGVLSQSGAELLEREGYINLFVFEQGTVGLERELQDLSF